MCEACCPGDGIEQVRPELMAALRRLNERKAHEQGRTIDEYLKDPLASRKNRFLSWLEDIWLNVRLLKPTL
jgi:hypothetical protein